VVTLLYVSILPCYGAVGWVIGRAHGRKNLGPDLQKNLMTFTIVL